MRHFLITKNGVARLMICRDDTDGASEVAKWHAADQAQVTAVREISEADIPEDRDHYLRDAWEDDGGNAVVNMTKAKAAFERAVRAANLDVPQADSARTPTELKALWPVRS
jgi:hypothetical protein